MTLEQNEVDEKSDQLAQRDAKIYALAKQVTALSGFKLPHEVINREEVWIKRNTGTFFEGLDDFFIDSLIDALSTSSDFKNEAIPKIQKVVQEKIEIQVSVILMETNRDCNALLVWSHHSVFLEYKGLELLFIPDPDYLD